MSMYTAFMSKSCSTHKTLTLRSHTTPTINIYTNTYTHISSRTEHNIPKKMCTVSNCSSGAGEMLEM